MNLKPFKLERYFAKYEFSAKYMLSSSDCDGWAVKDILSLADPETLKIWEELRLGYTESLGLPMLRKEVSGLYKGISEEDVLIVVPEEGIFITINVLLKKGDHIICTYPGYQSLYEIAESLGCEITKWLPEEEDNWRFDPAFLEKNIKKNTRLVIVNFPHNPTGSLASHKDFQKIIDIAKDNNIYLFSDEMYRFLEINLEDRLPSACEVYDKAISLFGMSKTFGMAGVRLGWVATKNKELYKKIMTYKDYVTICPSAPSEILSLIALKNKDIIINKHLERIRKNLKLLDIFFAKYSNLFSWIKPKAGTIGFPRLKTNINSLAFCQKIVEKTGIMLLPSTVYDFEDRYIRIGFGRENMPEVLKQFDNYISSNPIE